MSKNPTNRGRSRHVDVKVHYLRDLVQHDHVKIVKCAGTKRLTRLAFEKHREHMWGTRVPFSAFFSTVETKITPVKVYIIKLSDHVTLLVILYTL
jgi:hypothetical protein